jgi:hypothetical protein
MPCQQQKPLEQRHQGSFVWPNNAFTQDKAAIKPAFARLNYRIALACQIVKSEPLNAYHWAGFSFSEVDLILHFLLGRW